MASPAASGRSRIDASSKSQEAGGLPLPRWALWLMLPGIVGPVLVLAFIVITQMAHDPARCPFHERSRQTLGAGVVVVEEVRSCIPHVQERRYSLLRGNHSQLLGERRLDERAFGAGYSFAASLSATGEAKVVVRNEGHGELTFREGTAAEHAQDPRRKP
jgi:hypothetical protein